MTIQKFSVEDPHSWHLAAVLDEELHQMTKSGVKARFSDGSADLSLSDKRAKYNALFVQDAHASLEQAQGAQGNSLLPLVILIHGGGFMIGNAEMETPICVEAVRKYGCVAISLEYRLSPEARFPVAYEDCWDAIIWVLENTEKLKIDPSLGFVLGGTSAGSHISIPLAHRARDQNLQPPITGIYHSVPPVLPPQALTEKYKPFYGSREALKDGMALTSKSTDAYDVAVMPDFQSPLWSPLLWPTGHRDLPPTFFQICGADLLRDEALIYERELRLESGVKTKTIVYEGLPHIFWYNYPTHTASRKFWKDAVSGVGWLLGHET
ncbi:hypothetical protein MBLNU13_g05209t2 [Cladosporium sp. NU13]